MKREVKFSLVFRDMWQSAGKYVPRVDQLVKVAPAIIEMGCFARVETNGGGFEQVNLLFGENPNKAVREWTKPFHEAGIQTHMLDRALNGLRMSPVPADVRKLFYKVKKAQGTDITRTFCGLNDVRNIAPSITYAKEAGMISQCSLCITHSPIHTVEYYTNMALELIKLGADEICIKDMAGIGRPVSLGKIVANIKAAHPEIPVQYHSHAGPGFNMASILEVCEAGCDYIDVGMEPLSWGTGHADLLSVQAMLKDAGYQVPEINMEAYMKVRGMIQEFMDDFLGLYISPKNRLMNSLLIAPGLPGGMMGSLMADLESNLESINKYKAKHNLPFMTQDQLLIKLFDEVAYVWPRVGYPPLVTPFSQYVKNLAMMNVMAMEKGKERWGMIADDIWDMILEARDISFSYERKGAELFSNIKFKVENNERVWVPGPSGYGKTTLCKILAGYLEPCKGQILLDGKPLPKKGYCPVQMIWQHPERTVNPRLKMEKILSDGGQVENRIIEGLGIEEDWLNRYPQELSGGELQRFCIARALGKETRFLIADEISTMLDLITQSQIWNFLLDEVKRREIGLIVVSHSEALLKQVAERKLPFTAEKTTA